MHSWPLRIEEILSNRLCLIVLFVFEIFFIVCIGQICLDSDRTLHLITQVVVQHYAATTLLWAMP